jgi:hypothetical protein
MDTITFKIRSNAALQTLHVAPSAAPTDGDFVPLVPDQAGMVGEIDLDPGSYTYLLVLRAGQPGSPWGMSIQRENNQPVPRSGNLNEDGDGGDVGVLTIF